MAVADLGVKRLCPTTGKRFYDLTRSPIISPYTGEEVVIETPGKNRSTAVVEKKAATTAKAKEKDEDDDILDEDDVLDDADGEDNDDTMLDDEEDDNVSLDEIADVAKEDDD